MTRRNEEGGRPFTAFERNDGWSMSVQATEASNARPRERLGNLGDYLTVEVTLDGPHGRVVDRYRLDLPAAVAGKYPRSAAISHGPTPCRHTGDIMK